MEHIEGFEGQLSNWYEQHKRHLPWRETTSPYHIWLSEIILQQTRIDQGLAYFNRFVESYPTIEKLASASEDEVLKLWQGLGYYSRARNLHKTAKYIATTLNGQFPDNYANLLKLKGVGEYTAAAIASVSFGLPYAVVDGNVYRVIARLFGIDTPIDSTEGKKKFKTIAQQLLHPKHPDTHNQAMMEFGATQCVPKKPNCESCIFKAQCFAFAHNLIDQLPVKSGKTKIRHRYFSYFVLTEGDSVFLQKRTEKDIWRNLYEFPMIETSEKTETKALLESAAGIYGKEACLVTEVSNWSKQVLSHQHIHYRFIQIKIIQKNQSFPGFIRVNKKDIFNFAVPKPIERKLEMLRW